MTEKQKAKFETVSLSVILILLFSFGGWLTVEKSSRSELKAVEMKVDKVCEKQEKFDELVTDIRLDIKEIKTMLKERLK